MLVDAGDVVVHVFRPEVRAYYDLEGMWSVLGPSRIARRDAPIACGLSLLAVGQSRGTEEGALCDEFVERAARMSRGVGIAARRSRVEEASPFRKLRAQDAQAHAGRSASAWRGRTACLRARR